MENNQALIVVVKELQKLVLVIKEMELRLQKMEGKKNVNWNTKALPFNARDKYWSNDLLNYPSRFTKWNDKTHCIFLYQ